MKLLLKIKNGTPPMRKVRLVVILTTSSSNTLPLYSSSFSDSFFFHLLVLRILFKIISKALLSV